MIKQILWTLGLVLLTSSIMMPIIWQMPNDDQINEVNCYDRFANKIEGLKCEEKIIGLPYAMKIFLSCFAVLFPTLFGLACFREGTA